MSALLIVSDCKIYWANNLLSLSSCGIASKHQLCELWRPPISSRHRSVDACGQWYKSTLGIADSSETSTPSDYSWSRQYPAMRCMGLCFFSEALAGSSWLGWFQIFLEQNTEPFEHIICSQAGCHRKGAHIWSMSSSKLKPTLTEIKLLCHVDHLPTLHYARR